ERASGPWTCPPSQRSRMPSLGIRPAVVRMPTTPQKAAGMRMEQPKSVPWASGTIPLATAAAEPPDEPAGLRAGFQGLRVAPKTSLTVFAPVANSGVFVLPRINAPDARRRDTTAASVVGT